jgi:DNA-binding MarR family transcriptional regulator
MTMPQRGSRRALDLWLRLTRQTLDSLAGDLTLRQMAVLLHVYLLPPPHTVRGLAATLRVSKPAISRALDRLGRLGFTKRSRDSRDKRNVLVQRTVKGSVFLTDFGERLDSDLREPGEG